MASLSMVPIEKLSGRENYNNWEFAVKAYLQHEGLWSCIENPEAAQKADISEPEKKKLIEADIKAKAKLIMCVQSNIFVHIRNLDTSKQVWDKLKSVFQDDGLSRRVTLMRKLITTRLVESKSMEEYVGTIETTTQMLNDIKFDISEEWTGTFLLAGLPDRFKPMIMAMESSGARITGEYVKSKLLQEGTEIVGGAKALTVQQNYKKKKKVRCFKCNEMGHFANKCTRKQSVENKSTLLSVLSASELGTSNEWIIDSGASAHMTNNKKHLSSLSESLDRVVRVANNQTLTVDGVGKCELEINVNKRNKMVDVNVIHVPELSANLLSVSQIARNGKKIIFDNSGCKILDNQTNQLIATATLVGDLYKLDMSKNKKIDTAFRVVDFDLWHRRMGHTNYKYLQQIFKGTMSDNKKCEICLRGKQHKNLFLPSTTVSSEKLELVHGDLCGPIECESLGGSRYIFVLVDDYTHKTFVYLLKRKSETYSVFEKFKALVENETGNKLKVFRSDNGDEFCSKEFEKLFGACGIKHETSIPYNPQQNGLVERMNRTIIEKARCMLIDMGIPKNFWAEAVNTAVYLINRSPTSSLNGGIPEQLWTGKDVNLNFLKVFGSKTMVHIPKNKRKKFDQVAEQHIMVGYSDTQKGYRVYNTHTGEISVTRDAVFDETNQMINFSLFDKQWNDTVFMPMVEDTSEIGNTNMEEVIVPVGEIEQLLTSNSVDESIDCVQELSETQEYLASEQSNTSFEYDDVDYIPHRTIISSEDLRRSGRKPKPNEMDDFIYSVEMLESSDPITVEEALSRGDSGFWKKAMDEEIASINENKTWTLIDTPLNSKPIQSKWVFKTKQHLDGSVHYKARLVIKGCAQRYGIDYQETYAPVVKYNSIRYLLAMAVEHNMHIEQMDAVTAFLQGELKENVLMYQPKQYDDNSGKVCKLNKAIYGLKQAGRAWNEKLDKALKDCGLTRSKADPCIYLKWDKKTKLIVAVYVDDILILSQDKTVSETLKNKLSSRFKMKDIGDVKSILGFRVTRDRDKGVLWLDQENYIKKILERFNMENSNPVATPVDINVKLDKSMSPKSTSEIEEMRNIPYKEAVGCLLYAAQGTRPDISYAVNLVSRYSNEPGRQHWNAVKRIFRYLKGTMSAKLEYYKSDNTKVIGYSDSDWASDIDGRKSITGYVFTKCGGAITWSTRKQQTVALSTTEAEYMAVAATTQEAIWIRKLNSEFGVKNTIEIFCDNVNANILAKNDVYHARTKHIDVKHHFVRERMEASDVKISYLSSEEMTADVLTKGLPQCKHHAHRLGMGIKI